MKSYPYFTSGYYIKGFFGPHRYLSNFHQCPIVGTVIEDGVSKEITFRSSENAYQYRKALMAKADPTILSALVTCSPAESKSLAKLTDLGDFKPQWDYQKKYIMEETVLAKFRQNPDIQEQLLATRECYLEEANSWGDKYWGVSYIQNTVGERSVLGDYWTKVGGRNCLGAILMKVRETLYLERQ